MTHSSFDFKVIIPARLNSSRLPRKPLAPIVGKPMVQHVFEQVKKSGATEIIIATDSPEIETIAKDFGANVCMTDPNHPSGTDRLQEVCQKMQFDDQDVIVNVQGDEPLIPSAVINQVAGLIERSSAPMATLFEPINDTQDIFNPNVVKVVTDNHLRALYFSRAPVPWDREKFPHIDDLLQQNCHQTDFKRHVGIYAYRVALLNDFVTWPQSPLESLEKLEQLRVLEHGMGIAIDKAVDSIPGGVDTPEDLDRVNALLLAERQREGDDPHTNDKDDNRVSGRKRV
ncbi:MAG: 3-deoxy-manno-octulosonate cytidylyltransferase [Cellvibrionales bacterium]|nr:3-deoxy-manno-octulosonate cytidylyltransferase [Cellvibrionales bacterium]